MTFMAGQPLCSCHGTSWTAGLAANRLRVICGPTAAGKSAIAATLALEYGATIISADSRQIYRGFDIGTAKPGPAERRTVPHRGIDVAEPAERYSASAWAEGAREWITEAERARRVPLIAGGTGFYMRALFEPLFDAPRLDASRRRALEGAMNELPLSELRRWCSNLDPAKAHLGRVQLSRAIETALLTGRRLSDLQKESASSQAMTVPLFRPSFLVVDRGSRLAQRIERRVGTMLDSGWVEEVRSLMAYVPPDAPAWKASGYRVVRELAEGSISLSAARERIIIETRQY